MSRIQFTSAHAKEVHDAGRAAFAALLAPPKAGSRGASTSGTSIDPPAPTPSPLPSDVFAQLLLESLLR